MAFYQIIVPIISIFFILIAYSSYKSKKKTLKEFLVWCIIFSGVTIIALDPRVVDLAKYLTGFQDSINALIFLGIGSIVLILFKIVIVIEHNEQTIDNIIKAIAIKDFETKYKEKIKK